MGKKPLTSQPRPVDSARIERQKKQRTERLALLKGLDCLRSVPQEELESLADLCTFRAFLEHETIIHESDQDVCLFMILQGQVWLSLHDKEGREVLIGVLGPGDCFGGWALFGDFFRRAGASAETHCYILQFLLSDIRALLATAPIFSAALHQIHVQRLAECTLARVPIFGHLSPVDRISLTALLESRHYPRDTIIVQEGRQGDALYLLESGQVVVRRGDHTIATLAEGDFFGEMSLLFNQPHNATVQTITPVEIAVMPARAFHTILEQRPDMHEHFHNLSSKRRISDQLLLDDQKRFERLALAVEHGLLRGSHVLVRRPELCPPDCRICEEACVTRHGHTRLRLNGFAIDGYDILDACRQCRVGAECVEACPEDAFEWNDKGALFITDACTGCGECVPACPYYAVEQVPRERLTNARVLYRLLVSAKKLRQMVQPMLPDVLPYTHRADKCDLCHDYDDMACLSQCPTGSLRYVPVETIFPL